MPKIPTELKHSMRPLARIMKEERTHQLEKMVCTGFKVSKSTKNVVSMED